MDNMEENFGKFLNDFLGKLCESAGITKEKMYDMVILDKYIYEKKKRDFENQRKDQELLVSLREKLKTEEAKKTALRTSNNVFSGIVELEKTYLSSKKDYEETLQMYETLYGKMEE